MTPSQNRGRFFAMAYRVKKPQRPEKVEAAAWYCVLGQSTFSAAKLAGIADNTLRNWMISDWWPEAIEEARQRIPEVLRGKALGGLIRGLDDADEYAVMARWVAERVIPSLRPPTQRRDHTTDGKPLPAGSIVISKEILEGLDLDALDALRQALSAAEIPDDAGQPDSGEEG